MVVNDPVEGAAYIYGQKTIGGHFGDRGYVLYTNGQFVEVDTDALSGKYALPDQLTLPLLPIIHKYALIIDSFISSSVSSSVCGSCPLVGYCVHVHERKCTCFIAFFA